MAKFRISDCTSERAPGRLIRRIDRTMREIIDERLAPIGLSYTQWATLKLTTDGVVASAGDLARELDYSTGATTRFIDGIEATGHLRRVRDGADRRVVRLEVTPAGRVACERGKAVAMDAWNEMLAGFDQDEADQFVAVLVKLKTVIDAADAARRGSLAEAAE